MAGQYLSDIATNLAQGKTGLNVLRPSSTLTQYALSAAKSAAATDVTVNAMELGVPAPFAYALGSAVADISIDALAGRKIDWSGTAIDTITSGLLPFFPGLGTGFKRSFTEGMVGGLTTYDIDVIGSIVDGLPNYQGSALHVSGPQK